jgi:hypothetical protein
MVSTLLKMMCPHFKKLLILQTFFVNFDFFAVSVDLDFKSVLIKIKPVI